MKIIRLSTFLDFGGIERKMRNLSYWNDEHEWIYVSINKGGKAAETIELNGKKVYSLMLDYKIPNLATIYKLYRFIKKELPDVLHSSGAEANFHGTIAAKLAGVPVIITEEIGIPKHSVFAKMIFKFIFEVSDFVVGESALVIKHLDQKYHVAKIKLKQISNFVISPPDYQRIKSDVFTIVSVSRLEKVKNLDSLLRVLKLIKASGIPFKYIMVGDGPEYDGLKRLIIAYNLTDCVDMVGFQDKPGEFLSQSDLYIINSFTEGFSNSLLEAMMLGIPSLTTDTGAARELISDSESGWIVPVNDEKELFDQLCTIMALEATDLSEVGNKGKKTVTNFYSIDRYVNALMEIYSI